MSRLLKLLHHISSFLAILSDIYNAIKLCAPSAKKCWSSGFLCSRIDDPIIFAHVVHVTVKRVSQLNNVGYACQTGVFPIYIYRYTYKTDVDCVKTYIYM